MQTSYEVGMHVRAEVPHRDTTGRDITHFSPRYGRIVRTTSEVLPGRGGSRLIRIFWIREFGHNGRLFAVLKGWITSVIHDPNATAE